MAWKADGQIKIPAKLVPSPLCAPARFDGKSFANPVRKQRRWQADAYPLHHPLRQAEMEAAEIKKTARLANNLTNNLTERHGTMNIFEETEMARHNVMTEESPRDFVTKEIEAEWERKRQSYASTVVDSEEEAAAVGFVVDFAELHGHAAAECFVGHWHFHGEGGLPQSAPLALRWYERSALHGDETAAAARDKMYLDGLGCDPALGASLEQVERAVSRLRDIATPSTANSSANDGTAVGRGGGGAGKAEEVERGELSSPSRASQDAARKRLVDWGYDESFWAPSTQHADAAAADAAGNRDVSTQPETTAGVAGGGGGRGRDEVGAVRDRSVGGASIPVSASQRAKREEVARGLSDANPMLGLELQRERERRDMARELAEVDHEFESQQQLQQRLRTPQGGGVSRESGGGGGCGNGHGGGSAGAGPPFPVSSSSLPRTADSSYPFGGGSFGAPPRRWTPFFANNNAADGGGGGGGYSAGGGLRTAADVVAAAPAPGKPRGLAEASLEGELSLRCVLASRSYDEYMVMLETLKVQQLDRSTRPSLPPARLPDDALTYGIYQRDKFAEDSRIAALCDPTTVAQGWGLKIPHPSKLGHGPVLSSTTKNRTLPLQRSGGQEGAGSGFYGGGGERSMDSGDGGAVGGFSAEPLGGLVALGGGGYAGGSVAEMSVLRGGRSVDLVGLSQVVQGTAGGNFLVGTAPRRKRGGGSGGGGRGPAGPGVSECSPEQRAGLLKSTESRMYYGMTLAKDSTNEHGLRE